MGIRIEVVLLNNGTVLVNNESYFHGYAAADTEQKIPIYPARRGVLGAGLSSGACNFFNIKAKGLKKTVMMEKRIDIRF